jgi:transmembrane sensor
MRSCLRPNRRLKSICAGARWLEASEEHRHAWRYVQTVSQRFQPLSGGLASAAADTLLRPSTVMGRRRVLKLTALFASGTLLSWLTYRHTPLRESLLAASADYRSTTGEIKQLTLQDGTRLWLNTASAVDVRYDERRRQIILLSGDLLIDTARDSRPFLSQALRARCRHWVPVSVSSNRKV